MEQHTLFIKNKDGELKRFDYYPTYRKAIRAGQRRGGHGRFMIESARSSPNGKLHLFAPEPVRDAHILTDK